MGDMTDHQAMPETTRSSAATARADQQEALKQKVQHLMIAVESILRARPAGISELDLIRALQAPPWELLETVDFSSPERLYPVHFLTFHALYRLRDDIGGQGEQLSISPLLIRLGPGQGSPATSALAESDKLRAFYLDLDQYALSEQTVSQMMDDFWAGRSGRQPAAGEVSDAAVTLGFDRVPDHFEEVKYRFRRAVMQAHPDRGGRTEDVQALNEAFGVLRVYYVTRDT
ncbi:MAG: DNA-J related domain-containing protein [Marinobacter sp.]|uniref:DNA-J related domain-containing protein n=1 Tax=Marinobacter sp. TaxID=50741 RepID=UPI00299EC2D9|nr:DNA-J related domain-containing protein [Marinobacter sp.]MDX1635723.1 DNA-J related domain-containing protein [Marinobacter sp.]